jgi:hypothetical protein
MSFVRATVHCVGTRPLLFHTFSVEALSHERKAKGGSAGNSPDEWRNTFRMTEDRQLYLTPDCAFACFKGAGAYTKIGKGNLSKKLAATLQVFNDRLLIDRYVPVEWDKAETKDIPTSPLADVYLDIRGVINPNSKGRNVRYRVACKPGWETTIQIGWDSSIVSKEQIKPIVKDAGVLIGLGDGRSIGLGRFDSEIEFD